MYYEPTSKKSCDDAMRILKADGFEASLQHAITTVKRKTSEYNKYMKWQVIEKCNGCLSSKYFKSRPEAMRSLLQSRQPMPIGNSMSIRFIDIQQGE